MGKLYKYIFILAVDSELAQESNLAVQEMLNGCLCCVLVGQMKLALLELKGKYFFFPTIPQMSVYWFNTIYIIDKRISSIIEKYNPDRVIIETR